MLSLLRWADRIIIKYMIEEKYLKLKCNKCGKSKFVKEDDAKHIEYTCKKCSAEIEKLRLNNCLFCNKEFKPQNEEDYREMCDKCYNFITNKVEPTGKIKEVFEALPSYDGFLSWGDLAKIKYKIYKILK